MARGTTLSKLRLMLRAEIGQTLDTSASTQMDTAHNQLLSNKQQWFTAEYDWPFLEQRWDVNVTLRYTNLPTNANTPGGTALAPNFERPMLVEAKFNNFWRELIEGIGSDEFNYLRSDDGVQQDPILRWRLASNVNEPTTPNQFEVWPIPVTSQPVRFTGQRVVQTLFDASASAATNDARTADIDDLLLVYAVAADLLLGMESPRAQAMSSLASERFIRLRASYPSNNEPVVLGRGRLIRDTRSTRRLAPIVIAS